MARLSEMGGRARRPERWVGIEFRHFEALAAVAEEASFNRAAERLGYTQPAISQQIAALERAVGQKLIERVRGSSRVTPTNAGRLLLRHAEEIGARLAAAHSDLQAMEHGSLGAIRVGTFHTLGGRLISQILGDFQRLWPNITVDLTELAGDRELLVSLEHNELDVVFAHLPLPPGTYEPTRLFTDDYVLVVARGASERAGQAPTSIEEVAKLPLVGLKSCRGCEPFVAHLESLGLKPAFVYRADSIQTIEGLIAAGLGSAVMPRLATELMSPEVEIVELGSLNLPSRSVAVVRLGDKLDDRRTSKFVETACLVCSRALTFDKSA
jgi:DNA-binding transcriptional LysR family regulator